MHEILLALDEGGADLAVLTETKRKGRGNEDLDNYIHLWSGVDKSRRAAAGVSILINKRHKNYIKTYEYRSERIMTLTLSIYGYDTTVIAVYAPTDDSTQQLKDDFYADLSGILDAIPHHREVILTGDLNARVGSRFDHDVVGQFCEICVNNSGEMLVNFCAQSSLKILNGFFEHKKIHRYTWERPSLHQKSVLDYFICRQRSRFGWQDCRVKRGPNCGSDHYMVEAKMVCPFVMKQPSKQPENEEQQKLPKEQRWNLCLLQQESIRTLYQRRLAEELRTRLPNNNVETEYENIKAALQSAAMQALGPMPVRKMKRKPPWFTEEIKKLIEDKNNLFNNWLANKNQNSRDRYRSKNRELKKKIKETKDRFWEEKCYQIENYIGGAQSTEVWRTIRSLKTNETNKTQI
ncbi:craniofacial development protein 2-like [Coccinella septempunctata]|uniref:craniofacial development protein 2-like n=1 Tax=Coccinella septempunctata TaxID=41139 RepID=UPI001D088DFE|nr:craniofacial development protein 2-like [Coccinella septempunctata]